jgi:uncharacterized protein (DUF2062 family)
MMIPKQGDQMKKSFKSWTERLLLSERSPEKLAASFCLGTFIAITPTIPLQTPLIFLCCWLFRLNSVVAVAAAYIVNNPFTMIPIYVIDYAIGMWVMRILGIDLAQYNPSWVERFNTFISEYVDVKKYLGADLCFWCLIIGGFLFAALITIPLYPILTRTFRRLLHPKEKRKK